MTPPDRTDRNLIRELLAARDGSSIPILRRPDAAARPEPSPLDGLATDSRHLFEAWKEWRGTALLPRRSAMDLVAISRLMPRLVVIDVHAPDHAVFRLAGTEIEEQYGQRLTGRSYVKMVAPERQQRRGELLWRVAQQPCGALQYVSISWASGRQRDLEFFGLPMLPDREGEPVQILGVFSRLPAPVWGRTDSVTGIRGLTLHFIDIGAGIPAAL